MKILLLDIETAPNLAYVWGLFQENIPTARIVNSGYVLCWAAKWFGSREMQFCSGYGATHKSMLQQIHHLLDEADVVVHYNGKKFDIPTLNKEFVTHGLTPPSPYKQIDLYQTARTTFRFPSNKLDYVSQTLGIGQKVRHAGFELWVQCMAGDPKAWRAMERYNRGDVRLLERMYRRLRPWVRNHPNVAAEDGVDGCPSCGSRNYIRQGTRLAKNRKYPRYQCSDCGSWFHGTQFVTGGPRVNKVSS